MIILASLWLKSINCYVITLGLRRAYEHPVNIREHCIWNLKKSIIQYLRNILKIIVESSQKL
jgi:hypothetical protein